MAKKPVTIAHLDASISRWKTRLKRAITMIDKLEKQRKRIEKAAQANLAIAPPTATRPRAHAVIDDLASTLMPAIQEAIADQLKPEIDTSIPSFLKRTPDPVAEQIKAEQAEIKKKKAQGRIAKMKAKQSGEMRKMPLTGKAALDAIRNG